MFSKSLTMHGPTAVLEPLAPRHRDSLRQAAAEDESIWTYFPIGFNGAGEHFNQWFDLTLRLSEEGRQHAMVVKEQQGGRVVGTTRYYDMVPEHRRIAIGSTWYAQSKRGTLLNSEVRLLTLYYAFERLAVNRVEFITDPRNLSSRAAMKMLGAVQEGVIRNHLIYKDGRIRDSLLFSIIACEWPEVRDRLLQRLSYASVDVCFWKT